MKELNKIRRYLNNFLSSTKTWVYSEIWLLLLCFCTPVIMYILYLKNYITMEVSLVFNSMMFISFVFVRFLILIRFFNNIKILINKILNDDELDSLNKDLTED